MSFEMDNRILTDQHAELHHGRQQDGPARIWVIDPAGAGPAAVEAAQRDLSTLATLDQPALLPVAGSGILPDGRLWASVPAPPDRGLDELLADHGPLSLPRLRTLARTLCSALAALHQQGMVHGGIKPSLVRYDTGGPQESGHQESGHQESEPQESGHRESGHRESEHQESGHQESESRLTGSGWASLRVAWLARGTTDLEVLRRSAPELITGRLPHPDRQADIFGLGCVIFEAATGRPAFAGSTEDEVYAALTRPERPDVREALGPAEERLTRVLGRCLQVDPQKRYPSATTLWRELAPALGGRADPLPVHHSGDIADAEAVEPTPATNGRAAEPAQSAVMMDEAQARRGRGSGLLTVGITAVAGLVALVIVLLARHNPPREDARAETNAGPIRATDHRSEPRRASSARPRSMPRQARASGRRPAPARRRSPGVPPTVSVSPSSRQLVALLARVGMNEREVVVSGKLARLFARASRALLAKERGAFFVALERIDRLTRPERCREIRRQKRFYVLNGIRWLGKRLPRWDRFRIERRMADIHGRSSPCLVKSRKLTPLVEEIRDRLARKRTR